MDNNKQLNFIDVSGVGNSGKTAVTQILSEVRNIWVPHHFFEFDLLRIPGGLIDLKRSITDDWSPIRSHYAYNSFMRLIYKMGEDPKPYDILGHFKSGSTHYNRVFNGSFIKHSEQFLSSFLVGSYLAEWPYDRYTYGNFRNFSTKILYKLGMRKQLREKVLIVSGDNFNDLATDYLNNLYKELVPEDTNSVVLNNGFEPFNPKPFLDTIYNSKQITVQRDPRDIYVTGMNDHNKRQKGNSLKAFDNDGLNKSFLASDSLELFVNRVKVHMENLPSYSDKRILRLQFEDLVNDYEDSISKIFSFLDIDPTEHIEPRKYFDPDNTSMGSWKEYSNKKDIEFIEDNLSQYLYRP